jgi:cobalamin biosynthesis protein CbiG
MKPWILQLSKSKQFLIRFSRLLVCHERKVNLMEKQEQQAEYLWIPSATTMGVICKEGVILASENMFLRAILLLAKAGTKFLE